MNNALLAHQTEYKIAPHIHIAVPTRVHLFGERAWYFKDKTVSLAVDKRVEILATVRDDNALHFWFPQLNERKRGVLTNVRYRKEDRFANVLKGVLFQFMEEKNPCKGLDITVYSEIVPSAGLGVTTALKVGMAQVLRKLFAPHLRDQDLIHYIDLSNKLFLDVPTCLADLYTAFFAKKNTCLITDYNTNTYYHIPFEFDNLCLLLTDAKVPRVTVWNEQSLWTPEFACLLGDLKTERNGEIVYNDSDTEINEVLSDVSDAYRKRLLCIIKEQQLLLDALEGLKNNRFSQFARAVYRSHDLMRDLFTVSCPEVDWLVKRVQEMDTLANCALTSCARITGKGFATYTMLKKEDECQYHKKLAEYERIFGFHPQCFKVSTDNGISFMDNLETK